MPSTSKKQHNFMAAIAHSPAFAKKVGVPQSVGQDFNKADKGRKFREGGLMESEKAKELRHARTLAKISKEELAEANKMKKGGMTMATKGVNPFAKFEKSGKDKETGKAGKEGSKKEEAFDKKQMPFAKGGGVESKGKTKGKMIVMKKGGKC
jgi:hypothetical protein